MYILGAGMAGCLAGIMNSKAQILEASPCATVNHRAVLRFRSPKVGQSIGIKFKQVTIQKGIWADGEPCYPSPKATAMYSNKVIGKYSNRSIMDIDSVTRWIAPNNFHELMLDRLEGRIAYGQCITGIAQEYITTMDCTYGRPTLPVISTLPLPLNASLTGQKFDIAKGDIKPIFVSRFRVENCDMYSTMYFPGSETNMYRASLNGDILIIECMGLIEQCDIMDACVSLGINYGRTENIEIDHKQSSGKITPIDDRARKEFIYRLSHNFNIYSLGRFATWRNILLDDVVDDIVKIREMINNPYDMRIS